MRIKYKIPPKLNTTPPIFFADSGSLIAKAAINMVYRGESEATIEQSIGVIWEIAIRKVICVRKKPSTDAARILGRSRFSTTSFGLNSEISQKRAPAPNERSVKRASGVIVLLDVKSLHTIMLSPKIRYAVKHAICPKMEFFSFIIINNSAKIAIFVVLPF